MAKRGGSKTKSRTHNLPKVDDRLSALVRYMSMRKAESGEGYYLMVISVQSLLFIAKKRYEEIIMIHSYNSHRDEKKKETELENEKRRRIRARPSSVLTSSVSHLLSSSQSCTRKVVQKGSTMPDGLHVCPLKYAWLLLHYCSKRKTGKLIGVVVGLLLLSFLFRCRSLHGNNSNHHNINIKPKATPKSNY